MAGCLKAATIALGVIFVLAVLGLLLDADSRPRATPTVGQHPLPAPASSADLEAVAYLDYLRPRTESVTRALRAISEQAGQVSRDPLLMRDREWMMETAMAIATLREQGKALQSYGPVPSELSSLNDVIVSMGADLVYIADEYSAAIEQLSESRLTNATNRMVVLTAKTYKAKIEMDRLGERHR